jgi:riboflavin kinase/FMN adenylyltransferase
MKIIKVNSNENVNRTGTVATVGFFDGVHSGHLFLIEQLKKTAAAAGLQTAIVTFPLHPQWVLNPKIETALLTSPEEKLEYLAAAGIDVCYMLDFTPQFSCIDAETFIQDVLHRQLGVEHLLIGYDHRFGRNRESGFDEYVKYGETCGMKVSRAEELEGEHISSTVIRRLLLAGCIEEANAMLGHPYALCGEVVHGNHLGRTIGFPTANLKLQDIDKIIPDTGIYAATVRLGNETFRGMAYIGTRPTIEKNGEKRVEVNIFDFDREIYGETLRVEFMRYIREDRTFKNLEELREQLIKDRVSANN